MSVSVGRTADMLILSAVMDSECERLLRCLIRLEVADHI